MDRRKVSASRKEYLLGTLTREELSEDPIKQLGLWLEGAMSKEVLEPTAMVLATASKEGIPTTRTVLLKGLDARGLLFYTQHESLKGEQIKENPHVSVTFLWKELERQVEVDGTVEKISPEEAEAYFHTRPRESQLGAWASHQDDVLEGRRQLEENYEKARQQFEGKEVPVPPYWGGYLILPHRFVFWQGGPHRLHDRFCYRQEQGAWHIERLAP